MFNVENKLKINKVKEYLIQDIQILLKAIKENDHITQDLIKVDVNKGVVKLTGVVKNWKESKEVYNCAFYTDYIIDINNKLYIKEINNE